MTEEDDIDGLAAEYVLGSLDADERKEVAARRRTDAALDRAIKAWEKRLGPLSEGVPDLEPPPTSSRGSPTGSRPDGGSRTGRQGSGGRSWRGPARSPHAWR